MNIEDEECNFCLSNMIGSYTILYDSYNNIKTYTSECLSTHNKISNILILGLSSVALLTIENGEKIVQFANKCKELNLPIDQQYLDYIQNDIPYYNIELKEYVARSINLLKTNKDG